MELLDAPQHVLPDLAANLSDIRRINRWLGGRTVALRHIRRELQGVERATLLDVATGSADIPLAALHWSLQAGIDLQIVGTDVSTEILQEARRHIGTAPIVLQWADARSLPWEDGSFDVVTCCLALHHFGPDEARIVLQEMWRVARHGVIIVDLVRSYLGLAGAWLASRTLAPHRLTRHDAPLSVLKAYTPVELTLMAEQVGMVGVQHYHHLFCRQAIIARRRGLAHV